MNNYVNLRKERGMNTLMQKLIKSLIVLTMIVGSAATAFTNSMLTISAASDVVEITEENFPDPVVRELMESLDTDDSGWLSDDEIAAAPTTITVLQASNLTGLDYLTTVQWLYITDFQGETLDLTGMEFSSTLTYFDVSGYAIKNVELGNAIPKLERIWLSHTSVEEIDFSHNSTLAYANFSGNVKLKRILLNDSPKLYNVTANNNPILDYMDIRNTVVDNLNISFNPNFGVAGLKINDFLIDGMGVVIFEGTKTVDAFYEMFANATQFRGYALWDATNMVDDGYVILRFETFNIPLFRRIKLSDVARVAAYQVVENTSINAYRQYYPSSSDPLVFEPAIRDINLGGGDIRQLPDMKFTVDSDGYITSITLEVFDTNFVPHILTLVNEDGTSYRMDVHKAILQPGIAIGLGNGLMFNHSLHTGKFVDGHSVYDESARQAVLIVWDESEGVYKGGAGTNEYEGLTVVFDADGYPYFAREDGTKYVPISAYDKQTGNLPEHEIVIFDEDVDGNEVVVGVEEENYGYVADDGTIYVPVETDDGSTVFEKYVPNGDHSYTQTTTDGSEGDVVIIVDDELLVVEPQEDGSFIDSETGDIYIATEDGEWIVMDDSGVITFPDGSTLSLADIENCTTQAELDAIKAKVDTMIDCGIKDEFLDAIDAKQDEFDYAAARALVDALFTDGTHSELATGVTPADIAAAQAAADKVDDVTRNSTLDSEIDKARVLFAKGLVDALFTDDTYTAIKDTTMGYDIAAARLEVDKIVDPIEKARQTILLNKAQALFNERFNVNLDKDGNGIPDTNIDYDGDGVADINVDTDGDGVADWNLVQDSDPTGLNYDSNGDGFPDLNIDLDGDGIPDINIDLDGDGYPDLNIDENLDGIIDWNKDLNGNHELDADEITIAYLVIKHFGEFKGTGNHFGSISTPFVLFGADGKVFLGTTELTRGVDYVATNGSTIITLQEAYLKTLPNGTYTFDVVFGNGGATQLILTVNRTTAPTTPSVPHTGVDGGSMLPWVALLAASAGSITFLAKKKKTEEAVEAEVE